MLRKRFESEHDCILFFVLWYEERCLERYLGICVTLGSGVEFWGNTLEFHSVDCV